MKIKLLPDYPYLYETHMHTNIGSACKSDTADTSWMAGSVGVSTHWTSHTVNADGTRPRYDDAVARFDVRAYADTLAEAGAQHCIFTLTHAEQYLPSPLAALDRILPGRTARRDLVGDLIAALDEPFSPDPLPGKQDHRWICLDDPNWVLTRANAKTGFVPKRFTDEQIAAYIREHTNAGRMVTFNVLIDAVGRINPVYTK